MKNKIWLLLVVVFALSIVIGYTIEEIVNKELVGRPQDWYQVVLDCGQRSDCSSVACFERGDYYTCCCSNSNHPFTCCDIQ